MVKKRKKRRHKKYKGKISPQIPKKRLLFTIFSLVSLFIVVASIVLARNLSNRSKAQMPLPSIGGGIQLPTIPPVDIPTLPPIGEIQLPTVPLPQIGGGGSSFPTSFPRGGFQLPTSIPEVPGGEGVPKFPTNIPVIRIGGGAIGGIGNWIRSIIGIIGGAIPGRSPGRPTNPPGVPGGSNPTSAPSSDRSNILCTCVFRVNTVCAKWLK